MRKIITLIGLLALSFNPLFGGETQLTERLTLDPALRGVWMLHGSSDDKGKTVNEVKPAVEFIRADSMTLRMQDGDGNITDIKILKVFELKSGDKLFQVVTVGTGVTWAIDLNAARARKYVLIQVFDKLGDPEKSRVIITVAR